MTFTTTILNGKTEQVIIMKTTKKEACNIGGLESKKGLNPVCVSFGSDKIFIGYGYTSKEAIQNALKLN